MTSTTPEEEPAELSRKLHEFLLDQIGRLDPFEFVMVGSPTSPFVALEVGRTESDGFEVRVPPRLPERPLPVPKRTRLVEAGFRSVDPAEPLEPWVVSVADAAAAIDVASSALRDVFDAQVGETINLLHGSHRAEHDADQQLQELRQHVETLLTEFIGHRPERDSDDDFVYPTDHVRVIVAPRVVAGACAVVRIIAITNAGVTVSPELGLFLARLNFGLVFGRFALDAQHHAIWFDESLLGEHLSAEQLQFTITTVAQTAGEWAGRLKHMFGGQTDGDIGVAVHDAAPKPGTGGYL